MPQAENHTPLVAPILIQNFFSDFEAARSPLEAHVDHSVAGFSHYGVPFSFRLLPSLPCIENPECEQCPQWK